jgi:hypothetical protein
MNNRSKVLSYLGAVMAVVCILFAPVVGCGDATLNGLQIIEDKGVGGEIKLFIILALSCGVLIFFLKKHAHLVITAIAGAVSLFIAYLIAHGKNGAIELKVGAYLAFVGYTVTAITHILEITGRNMFNGSTLTDTSNAATYDRYQTKFELSQIPKIDLKKISVWFKKNGTVAAEWIKRNKKAVSIAAASIVILYIGYYFIIRNDPGKDAKKAAAASCDCTKRYNDGMISVYEEYIKSFGTYGFNKRQDARNKLQEMQNPIIAASNKWNNEARQKYNELRNKYVSKYESLNEFDLVYSTESGNYTPDSQSKMSSLYSDIENKIRSIKDPEPDIEKIKSDLIGKQIPGWNFSYLSEYKSAEIENVTRGNDRNEYKMKLHLKDETKNTEHDCGLMIVYLQGEQGWFFADFKMLFITYTYLVSNNEWTSISLLPNCQMSVSDDQKLSWKTYIWSSEIKTGPDARNVVLPNSNIYSVKSREKRPVTIKITFRPNN